MSAPGHIYTTPAPAATAHSSSGGQKKASLLSRFWQAVSDGLLAPIGRLLSPAWDDPQAIIGSTAKNDIRAKNFHATRVVSW